MALSPEVWMNVQAVKPLFDGLSALAQYPKDNDCLLLLFSTLTLFHDPPISLPSFACACGIPVLACWPLGTHLFPGRSVMKIYLNSDLNLMVPHWWTECGAWSHVQWKALDREQGVPFFLSPGKTSREPEGVKKRPPPPNVWSERSQKSPWNWISQNIVSSKGSPRQELLLKEGEWGWGSPYLNTGWDLGNQRQQCVKHYSTFWLGCSNGTSPTLFEVSTPTAEAGSASLDGPIIGSGWCFCSWLWSFEDPTCPLSSLPFPLPLSARDFKIETCFGG